MERKTLLIYIGLAGGIKSDGTLPDYVAQRVSYIAAQATKNDIVIFSSVYTLNMPPVLDDDGFPVSEAGRMYDQCIKLNSEPTYFLENASHDTIGSAFMLATLFKTILSHAPSAVVTSDFHEERSQLIFNHIFELAKLPNPIIIGIKSDGSFSERKRMEKLAIIGYRALIKRIQSWDELEHFIFTEHDNYSVQRNSQKTLNRDDKSHAY